MLRLLVSERGVALLKSSFLQANKEDTEEREREREEERGREWKWKGDRGEGGLDWGTREERGQNHLQ